jgi:hypothetical protein
VSLSLYLLRRAMDDSTAEHRERGPYVLDLGHGHGQVVAIQHDEVGLLTDVERA